MKKTFRNLLRRGRRSNEPPSAPTAPLPTPSTAHQSTHPVTPNTTAIPNNPQPISPSIAFTNAQYVDVSHSVFNQAGRDIINNNYQLVNRTCFFSVDLKPRYLYPTAPGQEATFQTPMVNSTSCMYSHLIDFPSLFTQPRWPTQNHMFRTSKCHAITRFSPDVRIVWRNFGGSFVRARYPVPEGVF
jgi:hypothetical protein